MKLILRTYSNIVWEFGLIEMIMYFSNHSKLLLDYGKFLILNVKCMVIILILYSVRIQTWNPEISYDPYYRNLLRAFIWRNISIGCPETILVNCEWRDFRFFTYDFQAFLRLNIGPVKMTLNIFLANVNNSSD